MDDLQFDILTLIPSHFSSFRDVLSFSLVCKKWYEATLSCSEINAPIFIVNDNIHWKFNLTHVILDKYDILNLDLKYIVQRLDQNQKSFSLRTINFANCYQKTDDDVKYFFGKMSRTSVC